MPARSAGGVDLLLGVEEVSGTGMQIGDTHQVVVLEGLKDFLTDLAVQNLKEVIPRWCTHRASAERSSEERTQQRHRKKHG